MYICASIHCLCLLCQNREEYWEMAVGAFVFVHICIYIYANADII